MSQWAYLTVSVFLALSGVLLLLASPAVDARALQPGLEHMEPGRMVGGLLLAIGLLGVVRVSRSTSWRQG